MPARLREGFHRKMEALKSLLKSLLDRPRAVQEHFFWLWRPTRAFREASEVNFAACSADDAFLMPTWTDFNLQKAAAGPRKSMNFVGRLTNFEISAF